MVGLTCFSPPLLNSAPLQTLWKHLLRRVFVQERPDAVLQKASTSVWDMLRRAPRMISSPQRPLPCPALASPPLLFLFPLPLPLQQAGSPLSYLMCTIQDRLLSARDHQKSLMWCRALWHDEAELAGNVFICFCAFATSVDRWRAERQVHSRPALCPRSHLLSLSSSNQCVCGRTVCL